MEFNYRYHGASTASHSADSSSMSFTPDTLREPTFFVGELNQHINFREAMSALHHVVVSDLRLQPKSREDYFAWLKSEETNMLADLASESGKVNAEVSALRQELNAIRTEKSKLMKPFYKAQDTYFKYLYKNDYNAWFVLDPVITVHTDSVFFECFSQDESSYGKLSCNLSVFKNVQEFACGTTNIDYSAELYNEFQKIRDYKTTMFNIDPSGFDVQTTNEESFFEPKIDLPDSWVRGFLQVSSAMSLPSARFSLHPMDMHNFLFVLKQKKERHGPRSIRFELTPDKRVVAVFEPWNRRVECKRSIYTGKEASEIRIWGRRRLMLLERLIPITKAFHVHLVGSGLPSFFEAEMEDMTFTLGLSGWTANDWSKVSNFDLMAPRGEADAMTCERVFTELKRYWYSSADVLAKDTGLERTTVLSALTLLTQAGKVIYDLTKCVYRVRELSREPLPMEQLRFSSEQEQKADNFINANLVTIADVTTNGQHMTITGSVMDNGNECKASITLDGDQRLVDGHSSSDYYYKNQLKKGPCEHMLALRRFHAKQEKEGNQQPIQVFSHAPSQQVTQDVTSIAQDSVEGANTSQAVVTEKTLFPKNKDEFEEMVDEEIAKNGKKCTLNHIDTSKITDMSSLFLDSKFNGDISLWDVSNVTDMSGMFLSSVFNQDISMWDVSSVTDMSDMFLTSKFNGDISEWDVSSVTHMEGTFWDSKFNQDISKWDVSATKKMSHLFQESKFTGDISQWNTASVNNMSYMFKGSKFNGDISEWNVSFVRNMNSMFENSIFNQDILQWNTERVQKMNNMFKNSVFNQDISHWAKQPDDYTFNPKPRTEKTLFPKSKKTLNKIINAEIAEHGNECNLNHIDTSSITDMRQLFSGSHFNGDISEWDTSEVKEMCNMFAHSTFNGDISQWDISRVTCVCRMFGDAEFNGDISQWDTSSVTFMGSMFEGNKKFNQDISHWDVSNVTNFSDTFNNSIFNQNISQWDVSHVKDMGWMFYNSEFNGDISQWNVSNVENMDDMFRASQFNQDISNWNLASVTSMNSMFEDSVFNQDISSWAKQPN